MGATFIVADARRFRGKIGQLAGVDVVLAFSPAAHSSWRRGPKRRQFGQERFRGANLDLDVVIGRHSGRTHGDIIRAFQWTRQ
jgi:hypothetical protein